MQKLLFSEVYMLQVLHLYLMDTINLKGDISYQPFADISQGWCTHKQGLISHSSISSFPHPLTPLGLHPFLVWRMSWSRKGSLCPLLPWHTFLLLICMWTLKERKPFTENFWSLSWILALARLFFDRSWKVYTCFRPRRIKILLHGQNQKKIGSVGRFFF